MNLPYIQSELFRELVGMETLLKPEYEFHIHKYGCDMEVKLWRKRDWSTVERYFLNPKQIQRSKKADQITAEINRIWQSIPAECKKENLPI